jgi:hypothetical protein
MAYSPSPATKAFSTQEPERVISGLPGNAFPDPRPFFESVQDLYTFSTQWVRLGNPPGKPLKTWLKNIFFRFPLFPHLPVST